MNVAIQGKAKKVHDIISIDAGNQQSLRGVLKLLFIRCENSSQNLGCLKTSTSSTLETCVKHYQNLNWIEIRIQKRAEAARKRLFV